MGEGKDEGLFDKEGYEAWHGFPQYLSIPIVTANKPKKEFPQLYRIDYQTRRFNMI
jgi:hypothetical protein